jgi:hypothetical protein
MVTAKLKIATRRDREPIRLPSVRKIPGIVLLSTECSVGVADSDIHPEDQPARNQ